MFAIAITLLILGIKVPKLPHGNPPAALGQALLALVSGPLGLAMNLSLWVLWAVRGYRPSAESWAQAWPQVLPRGEAGRT